MHSPPRLLDSLRWCKTRYQHEVDSFVPQVASPDQPLPLLACDLDLFEPETIPWNVRELHFEMFICRWGGYNTLDGRSQNSYAVPPPPAYAQSPCKSGIVAY